MKKQIPLGSTRFGNEVVITSPEEHNGFVVAYAYLEGIDTPVNKAIVETVHTKYGIPYMTELATMTYHGVHLWAGAVRKAGTVNWVEQRRAFGFLQISAPITSGRQPKTAVFGECLAAAASYCVSAKMGPREKTPKRRPEP